MIRTKKHTQTFNKIDTILNVSISEDLFGVKGVPDAILTADWHLRATIPSCRKEEFESAQWKKVYFISTLQKKYNIPVLHAGDLFDIWKPPLELVSKANQYIPKDFFTIYGNHDLPQHNLELSYKCGIFNMYTSGKLKLLPGIHWGQESDSMEYSLTLKNRKILVWHMMTYQGKKLYPGMKDSPAASIIRKTNADLVLTGHNHQSFVEEYKGRLLVNPGCITRQESDQADFTPKVYLYYAFDNTVESIILPHEKGVVEKADDVKVKEERDERINAFISKLNTQWDSTIDFDKNIERFLESNEITADVREWIYKALEK